MQSESMHVLPCNISTNSASKDNSDLNLRVPNMRPRELVAICHCLRHPLIHVGQEEIPQLSGSHLLMQCEAAVQIAAQLCDLNCYMNLCT